MEVITTEVTVWPFVTNTVETAMVLLELGELVGPLLLEDAIDAADTDDMDDMDAWE